MNFASKAITSLLCVAGSQAFTTPSPLNLNQIQSSIASNTRRTSSRFTAATIEAPTETTTPAASDESMNPKTWDCDEEANCVAVDACDDEVCRTSLDVRIHGEWYDLSGWRKAHPAGTHWIDWYDGRDATEVMDGFHSEKARSMWQRLPKSTPEVAEQLEKDVTPDSSTQINFRKLRTELEDEGWWKRDMVHEYKLIGIWVSLVVSAVFTAHSIPAVSIMCTALAMTNAGWLGHDFIHGVDKYADKMRLFAAAAAGLGPTWWSDKHNKHHALTNEMGVDEDIATDPFLFTWAPSPENDSPLRKIQHWIFYIPFSFMFALWRVDTMQVIVSAVEEKRPEAKKELWALLTHYFVMLTILPFYVWVPAVFISGLMSALIVTPTHQSEAMFEDYQPDFVSAQFMSTRNAVMTNPFSEWLWGGMQYQLEHHLFPSMPRSKYPALRERLIKFANDNKIPGGYRESGEFEILYMNWDLYRKVAKMDPVPGAPSSRGDGQLGSINLGLSPAAGGYGIGKA